MHHKYPKNQKSISSLNSADSGIVAAQWIDAAGVHCISAIPTLSPAQLEKLTQIYQDKIRNSPLWDEFLKVFGPEKAEEALKQCRVINKHS